MMSRFCALFLLVLPALLAANQSTLPPPAASDGVVVRQAGLNTSSDHWGNPLTLGAYKISGDGYQKPITPGQPDNQLGLVWNAAAPSSFEAARQSLQQTGGTLRVIFVGETAGWLNDFGYTYSGNSAGQDSFTVWKDIQSFGKNPNLAFGDYFDLSFGPGETSGLDLWFKANGGWQKTLCGSEYTGGTYTLFGSPGDPSQFLWADRSLAVNTWIPSISTSLLVDTYLIGLEDWRLGRGADGDFNDFRFAIQFLDRAGGPLAVIPESSFLPLISGMFVLGFALLRRPLFWPAKRAHL